MEVSLTTQTQLLKSTINSFPETQSKTARKE